MFSISDKVVCVDTKPRGTSARPPGYPYPTEGQIYVVRDVWQHPRASEGYMIQLVGFPEHHTRDGVRMGWTPSRFRKLTDIQAENAAALCANA